MAVWYCLRLLVSSSLLLVVGCLIMNNTALLVCLFVFFFALFVVNLGGSVLSFLVQKVQLSRYAIYRAFENSENI